MEVWSSKECRICQTTGVRAPKAAYERWREMFLAAIESVKGRSLRRAKQIYEITKRKIAELADEYPPCSFCEGKGVTIVRESDASVEEASGEDFWKK